MQILVSPSSKQHLKMSNIGTNSIIFKLKKQWAQLEDDVNALTHNQSKVYKKYVDSIIQTQNNKKIQLEKWRTNEIDAANQEYQGELYGADCDAKHSTEENTKKISDFIYFKADMMMRQFPEAAAYFSKQGYSFPFDELRQQTTDPNIPKIVAHESTVPIIDKDVIKEDLYTFTDNEIEMPEALQKSGTISLQIGNLPSFTGKVSDIQDTEANLTVGGESAPVYVNTVRFGETHCSKA